MDPRDVEVISICTLMVHQGWNDELLSYAVVGRLVQAWATENGADIYCRPREEFSEWEARRRACERSLLRTYPKILISDAWNGLLQA